MSQQTPSPDPFELLKKMWAPMGLPMPGMVGPLFDVNDIERRIADLKSVENWLNLNMNVLHMTIQGLEMQKATLAALQKAAQPGQKVTSATAAASVAASTADAWWNMLQQAQSAASTAPPKTKPEKKSR